MITKPSVMAVMVLLVKFTTVVRQLS